VVRKKLGLTLISEKAGAERVYRAPVGQPNVADTFMRFGELAAIPFDHDTAARIGMTLRSPAPDFSPQY
jgi:hypothetical protein